MKVVFFYIEPKEKIVNVSDATKNKEVVSVMIESVRKHITNAQIIQLSDDDTNLISGVDAIIRMGPRPEYLMPARMDYQYRFIADHCNDGDKVLFLDPDVIIQKNVDELFDIVDWDIGLTWRTGLGALSDQMPYNAGVIFTRAGAGARAFWEGVRNMVITMPDTLKKWYGDQMAMAELAGRGIVKLCTLEPMLTMVINNNQTIRMLLVPCIKYNYSPDASEVVRSIEMKHGSRCFDRLSSKSILHFKGGLKDYMVPYWNRKNEKN